MNPVYIAVRIAKAYNFSIHGLEYDIKEDAQNPGAVRIVLYEDNFNLFSDSDRMILTEQIIDLATKINRVVPCGIDKKGELPT